MATIDSNESIYILKLAQDKYYVGKTKNPDSRIQYHFEGRGSAWTNKYKPVETVEIIENCNKFDEDKYVLIYMEKFGIDNVRGGSYSTIKLDKQQLHMIDRQLISANDKCFKCGQSGHFIKNCNFVKDTSTSTWIWKKIVKLSNYLFSDEIPNKHQLICYNCNQVGHYSNKCSKPKTKVICFTCGKDGHYSKQCIA